MDFLFKCNKCPQAFLTSGTYRKHVCKSEKTELVVGLSLAEESEFITYTDNGLIKITGKGFETDNGQTKEQNKSKSNLQTYSENDEEYSPTTEEKSPEESDIKEKTEVKDEDGIKGLEPVKGKLYPFTCEICSRGLTTVGSLAVHMKIHSLDQCFSCLLPDCDKTFKTRGNMFDHMYDGHGYSKFECLSLKVKCPKCDKMYGAGDSFKRHIKGTHSEEKAFQCDQCPKKFKNKGSLKVHENFHTGNVEHKCPVCNKGYNTRSSMVKHIKTTHNEKLPEKNFSCDQCFKSFEYGYQLETHFTLHTGEKKLKCREGCEMRFRHHNNRNSHERIHKGVKPYQCNFCARFFRTGSALKSHIKTHTGVKDHRCGVCDRAFADPRGARNCTHKPVSTAVQNK